MAKKFIWDLPTRLIHWALVILIFGSWYTVEVTGDMDTHMLIGQTILALVLFRIVWGFIGTRYARFSSFAYRPGAILSYTKGLFGRRGSDQAGHNPLGGVAVFVILALLLAQTSSGLFATDGDFYAGPLNDSISSRTANQVTEFHEINFNVLVVVLLVHVAAALFYLLYKGQNLIAAMITGRKHDATDSFVPIENSMPLRASITAMAIAAVVYALVTYL